MNTIRENNVSDRALVDRVLGGDTNAFRLIMKNTEGLVGQIVYKMIRNPSDRKDIAQDIYLKTFQKLDSFQFQAKLSTWIGQIAYHTCLGYLEKKKLVLLDSVTDEEENEVLEKLNHTVNPFVNDIESSLFKQELSAILKTEIEKLSPIFRTLITLYHQEEMSYAEITVITQLPEGTVKSYLSRARKLLKDNLLLTYQKEAL
ncbi:RNA polymerase sigma factor [Emticicia agri]|uniref:Sigma-70 family RNA polymerase sigma factor n=1 Tax=Emticicia agri TaxID=2492393 RepID=A0A4Q5LWP4_9BACT|nr:sigma-70 family RNA polymerase sigma factor [Emticicia agri]RYU94221.1 sigma-70 family RNA polymerase sigma factor [Emticicia agri]